MIFEDIYSENIELLGRILFIVMFLLVLASLLLIVRIAENTGKKRMKLIIWSASCMCATIAMGVTASILDIDPFDKEAIERNLQQKYDIASVIDTDPRYNTKYPEYSGEQLILVETKDGDKTAFFLTNDNETSEPTLHELVDNEGKEAVRLEDISK